MNIEYFTIRSLYRFKQVVFATTNLMRSIRWQIAMAFAQPGNPTALPTLEYYCPMCHMFFNGHTQWKHHKKSNRHKRAKARYTVHGLECQPWHGLAIIDEFQNELRRDREFNAAIDAAIENKGKGKGNGKGSK